MKNKILLLSLSIFTLLVLTTFISAQASCQAPGNVSLACADVNCNFAIGAPFSNMTLLIKPTLGNISGILTKVLLCNAGTNCTTSSNIEYKDCITNADGTISIGTDQCKFKGNATKSGDYAIAVYIPSLSYTSPVTIIHVQPTLKITQLLCNPASEAINRPITCSWKVVNAYNLLIDISSSPSIINGITKIVTYGNQTITPTPVGTNGITFTTPSSITGSSNIKITIAVDATGYNGDKQDTYVELTGLSQTYDFYLDGKKLSSYTTSGIKIGSHTFRIVPLQSGQSLSIKSMDIKITTASSQPIPLNFIQAADGSWSATTIATDTEGVGYEIIGTAYPTDATIPLLPIDETFTLASGAVSPVTINWWIYVVIGIVVVIIIAIVLGVMFKPKKKK